MRERFSSKLTAMNQLLTISLFYSDCDGMQPSESDLDQLQQLD